MIHASFHFQLKYICFGCKAPHIHYSKLKTTPFPPAHWLPPATFKIFFYFTFFTTGSPVNPEKIIHTQNKICRINFEKDREVKVYKPTPGGQPNKIIFLFESSQEFTGGSDRFRTC